MFFRSAQNRGLEKLLMSSIFKLRPNAQRIFLHTRSTNQRAIELYEEWGFVQCAGKLPHWTDVEYLVEQSSIVQQTSATLVPCHIAGGNPLTVDCILISLDLKRTLDKEKSPYFKKRKVDHYVMGLRMQKWFF